MGKLFHPFLPLSLSVRHANLRRQMGTRPHFWNLLQGRKEREPQALGPPHKYHGGGTAGILPSAFLRRTLEAMRPLPWVLAFCCSLAGASGQGTIRFVTNITAHVNGACEVPPNDSPDYAVAMLSYSLLTYNPLSNTLVACQLNLPLELNPTSAGIYGPAAPGQKASLLFDLGQASIVTNIICLVQWPTPADCSTNVSVVFSNLFTFTPEQMNELNAGLFYVNVSTPTYPAGEIRGQFTSAPVLSQPIYQAGTGLTFKVTASSRVNYEVQFSSNLVDWSTFAFQNTTNDLFEVVDPAAPDNSPRFYRVRSP